MKELLPKLLFITSRFPYPLEKGDKLRAFYFIKELSKTHNVVLISLSDKKVHLSEKQKLEEICAKVYCFELKKWNIAFNLFLGLFSNKPFQVHYFYSFSRYLKINKIIKEEKPDHIFCQLIRVSEYVKNYHNCTKTIDYMDALSKGIERRKAIVPISTKWLFKMEHNRLLNYESLIFDYFDSKLIISKQDRKCIMHPQKESIKVIPNGIDASFFMENNVNPEFDLVFVGNLSYAPNIDAVEYILTKILAVTNFTCLISGANPSKYLSKKIMNVKNATLWADVEDIKASYCAAKIFIAPLFIGTGLQNKLLEAMALGLPCITTRLVNNSLGAKEEKQIQIADTSDEFIFKIETLLKNENQREKISTEAKEFIRNNYSWSKAVDLFLSKED